MTIYSHILTEPLMRQVHSRDGSFLQGGEVRWPRCPLHLWTSCGTETLGIFNASARHLLNDFV